MKYQCYIQGLCAISPQMTFNDDIFEASLRTTDDNIFKAAEPSYTGFIAPNNLRRMSKLLKMGIASAGKCLQESGVSVPDAIITGTGKGSLHDTEKFLRDIVTYEETALNPTQFIQSTFNAVNGMVALQQQCTQYNNTFVHRGFSFENALLDSMLQLAEGKRHVLLGGFEEITMDHYQIKSHSGWWKTEKHSSSELLTSTTPGTIAGEGSTFFLLSNEPGAHPAATIEGMKLLYKPAETQLQPALQAFLAAHDVSISDIDLLVSGRNGDSNYVHFYDTVSHALPGVVELPFKHLCGEYETANAFGVWLAAAMIRAQKAPQQWFAAGTVFPGKYRTVLLYNHFFGDQHVFLLMKSVTR